MSAVALLAAAGRGERLGVETPKAFVELGEKSLLAHALTVADACEAIDAVVVAVASGWEARAEEVLSASAKAAAVVAGGRTRQESVRRALTAAPDGHDLVAVHDVARPFASAALFEAVLKALSDADGVVPAVPVSDTVKRVRGSTVVETVPRDELVLVQTPQAFRRGPLEEAHAKAAAEGFAATDDAALLERLGFAVVVVPGDPGNVKITDPPDLLAAESRVRDG